MSIKHSILISLLAIALCGCDIVPKVRFGEIVDSKKESARYEVYTVSPNGAEWHYNVTKDVFEKAKLGNNFTNQ